MTVEHDSGRGRFFVPLGDVEATLIYTRRGSTLDFQHIFVPETHRGQGIAARILDVAFGYARENSLKVVPTCPFIRNDFLPRFDQYHDLIAT